MSGAACCGRRSIDDLTLVAPLVKSPVLVLWGEKDGLFDLTHQEKLEKAYPDAEFQIFKEGGHNMFWEFPAKAAKVINDFLDAPDNHLTASAEATTAEAETAGTRPAV